LFTESDQPCLFPDCEPTIFVLWWWTNLACSLMVNQLCLFSDSEPTFSVL
jgi:hypothetical protein